MKLSIQLLDDLKRLKLSLLEIFFLSMNDLVITSWNVRGANNLVAVSNVRKLVKESKANVLLLVVNSV